MSQIINNMRDSLNMPLGMVAGTGRSPRGQSQEPKDYLFPQAARWSDGSSVTAADFRRSWLRILDSSHGFLIVNSFSVFRGR